MEQMQADGMEQMQADGMDESSRRKISILLHDSLDNEGYSIKRIRKRAKVFKRHFINEEENDCHVIKAGSVGEGVSKFFKETDHDEIMSPNGIVCVDEKSTQEGLIVAQIDYSATKPGYVRLLVDSAFDKRKFIGIEFQSRSRDGNIYLSSQMTGIDKDVNGPAVTTLPSMRERWRLSKWVKTLDVFSEEFLSKKVQTFDHVPGLPFYSTKVMDKWLTRKRLHEWPSKTLQKKIATMMGYVVPVGHKSSPNQDIEWRISYTTAEIKLVHNMDNVQVKLYVVLKLVHNDRLKPACGNFTSYMVKNLVFWVLEGTSIAEFTPDKIVDRIMDAFDLLKKCLKDRFLPCYMIHERNLFDGRMTEDECESLLTEVEKIIDEGCKFLLKSHKLSLFMLKTYKYPEFSRDFAQRSAEIEDLFLMLMSENLDTLDMGIEEFLSHKSELVRALIRIGLLLINYNGFVSTREGAHGEVVFGTTLIFIYMYAVRCDYEKRLKAILS